MRTIAIVLLLIFPAQALGQLNYKFQVLPRGEKCESSEHWCYTLDEFKLLIEGDSELFKLRSDSKLFKEELETKAEEIANLFDQIETYKKDKAVLESESKRLTEKWRKADLALQKCENDAPMWPWIVTGLGGVALLTGVILILVDQNQEGKL